ncbi:HlyD family secretion protein, partial [Francisella tularensis subsp. holarctica]|nr:HlyD family secretion protein [Francisella tularensis subsp. holarctica]
KYNNIFPINYIDYFNADIFCISPKVCVYIEKVYIHKKQFVHKYDKLIKIYTKDYKLNVSQAKSKIIKTKGQLYIDQEQV